MSEQEQGPRTSYVYLIGTLDQRIVKIGYSISPRQRLIDIRIACPFTVGILWKAEGGAELEDALHQRFTDCRLQGEWFEFPNCNAVTQVSKAVTLMKPESAQTQPPPPSLSGIDRATAAVRQHLRDQGTKHIYRMDCGRLQSVH